ncbi:MAG TPA: TIGR02530 family flagellar biosynthesis protein [Bacillota bacterium]|jgi:flagellar operon protein|nr:flagellar protein [Bacillota bacterium]HOB86161.1 TIGR02530 family flagellar biosynthesis protein [Bacillota bacterium]HOP68872.1 TIGR02530 family flagellar biosynthesis protein [Bacillota bacterium]HPT33379.1 TIGR02530 family flagellar biosynthesis protein [Bacillota bacterium]HPZ65379.1 TIGR02530 family flagellar biosynthesis protein [Bacillota bacterium]
MVSGIGKTTPVSPPSTVASKGPAAAPSQGLSFDQILESARKKQGLVISAHAQERMERRKINLKAEDLLKISEAVSQAGSKGARSSLLLYGDVALLANIPSRTIITAMDKSGAKEHVFTGIDSAVIIK